MARLEIDNVLSKMKDLEDLIQGGMEITQECALDCEENEEGCPEVKELKNVMLAYASMSRDIKQWDKVARKTVTDFRKNYASSGDVQVNIEDLFTENLTKEQVGNTDKELEQSKALQEFTESLLNLCQSNDNAEEEHELVGDEEIHIGKVTGDKLLCPFSKAQMKQPVKNRHCGHSYDKSAIEEHIRRMGRKAKCPVVGCPQIIKKQDLEIDKTLARELKKRQK